MLAEIGCATMRELRRFDRAATIRRERPLSIDALGLGRAPGEAELSAHLRAAAGRNRRLRSYLGMGYHGTRMPGVVQRNILENPGWYTQYTPYQAEISQAGSRHCSPSRPWSRSSPGWRSPTPSLLDEATAAAEAMHLAAAVSSKLEALERPVFFVADGLPPADDRRREDPRRGGRHRGGGRRSVRRRLRERPIFGVLVQYPGTDGRVRDFAPLAERATARARLLIVACDPLALVLLRPPGEFGADVALGSTQRFGVPMGWGGPHAAFLATRDEYKRQMPGRIIGVSRDVEGRSALRMSLQTREQHIRREKATSNICTRRCCLRSWPRCNAVYHGPRARPPSPAASTPGRHARRGRAPARAPACPRSRSSTRSRSASPRAARTRCSPAPWSAASTFRKLDDRTVGIALDETVGREDVATCWRCSAATHSIPTSSRPRRSGTFPAPHARTSPALAHEVFRRYHTGARDAALPAPPRGARPLARALDDPARLGATMKLNATVEMAPLSWPELADLHPFAPVEQAAGYLEIVRDSKRWLAEVTGFSAVSLQPNAGARASTRACS